MLNIYSAYIETIFEKWKGKQLFNFYIFFHFQTFVNEYIYIVDNKFVIIFIVIKTFNQPNP